MPTRTSKPTTVSALAQQFVAANPETIEVANDRTNWPGVRRPLAAARALLQFADLGEALRKAAEEYIKTRGGRGYQQEGFRARFAAQLCEAAGVPFCKRCGRYLTDRPHSPCPFDAFQAALLGLPSLAGSQPAYFGLDKATRQALRSACAPIATSPRIDKDLSGIAGGLLYFLEKDTDSPYRSYQRRVLAISLTENHHAPAHGGRGNRGDAQPGRGCAMTATLTPLDLQQDEVAVTPPERRQRLAAGNCPIKQLPAGTSEKARRAEQRKCLTNARLAAHSGQMDIARAWVARAASYRPVSQRSLAAIKRSYDRGRDYRADQAEHAATLTARARIPAAGSGAPEVALTIITRPARDPELRELRIGSTLSQAPEPSPAQLDIAIACLEALLIRLHALCASSAS